MANEQKTTMFDKNDIADIIYNSFLRALETNNVKLNQRDKLIETLISEVNKLGKVSEKEEAKMREAVQSGFKKGASVTNELQKYFKDLERAINNKEYKRSKVTEAYPQASKTFEQREDRLKKSSVSRFNRLNEKYIRLVKSVETNVETLAATSNTLGETSRKLSKVTLNLIDKSDNIANNVSWLQNASQNITKSNEKATRLTRNLVGQSIKIDKEASWVESAVDNLRKSSRSLARTSNKGILTLDKMNTDGTAEKKQEEDGFIGKLVKKLENSKVGKGLLTDIFRLTGLGAAGWVYKKTGNKALAATAGIATPIALAAGTNLGYGLLKQKLLTGVAGRAALGGTAAATGATAGTILGLLALTKLSFDKGPNKYFKDMGDKDYAYSYEKMKRAGTLPSGAMKPNAKFLDYASKKADSEQETQKKIEKSVTGLFNMFKPAAQFISSFFGGIVKWIRDKLPKPPPPKPSGAGAAYHPGLSNAASSFRKTKVGSAVDTFLTGHGGWEGSAPLDASNILKSDLEKKVSKNKYYEKLSGGKGWSIDQGSFITDLPYAKAGTSSIMDTAINMLSKNPKYSGLLNHIRMTSALGSKGTYINGKFVASPHRKGKASHFQGTKGDWVADSEENTRLFAEGLRSTGMFSRVAEETSQGVTHLDVQPKKSEYDKIEAVKKSTNTPVPIKQPPAPSVVGKTSYDPTGNSSAMIAMMTINYQGMA